MDFNTYQREFKNFLLQYDKIRAFELLNQFINKNSKYDFVDKVLVNALTEIGEGWEKGTVALSQVYMSSKISEEIVEILLSGDKKVKKDLPPMAIVTLEDRHTLGKKVVSSVLRSSGYSLKDYGFGVSAEEVIEKAAEDKIKILIISVLMYPSALKVKKISDILHKKDPSTKILVGGAPFLIDTELWKRVGADAMGTNASSDIPIIEKWIEEGKKNA